MRSLGHVYCASEKLGPSSRTRLAREHNFSRRGGRANRAKFAATSPIRRIRLLVNFAQLRRDIDVVIRSSRHCLIKQSVRGEPRLCGCAPPNLQTFVSSRAFSVSLFREETWNERVLLFLNRDICDSFACSFVDQRSIVLAKLGRSVCPANLRSERGEE